MSCTDVQRRAVSCSRTAQAGVGRQPLCKATEKQNRVAFRLKVLTFPVRGGALEEGTEEKAGRFSLPVSEPPQKELGV